MISIKQRLGNTDVHVQVLLLIKGTRAIFCFRVYMCTPSANINQIVIFLCSDVNMLRFKHDSANSTLVLILLDIRLYH